MTFLYLRVMVLRISITLPTYDRRDLGPNQIAMFWYDKADTREERRSPSAQRGLISHWGKQTVSRGTPFAQCLRLDQLSDPNQDNRTLGGGYVNRNLNYSFIK